VCAFKLNQAKQEMQPMADNKLTPEEQEQLRQEEVDRLRKREEDRRAGAVDARAAGREALKDPPAEGPYHGDARPAVEVRQAPGNPYPTFKNVPGEGYRRNPANQATELPPERQAPRPADDKIGQGRVKPHEQPPQTEASEK
jgi:hypothetical protein